MVDQTPFGVWELKGDSKSPKEGLGEAFGYCTNIGISLKVKSNSEQQQKVIPLVSSNGRLITFGCVAFLSENCPIFFHLSSVLDLLDDGSCNLAACYLFKCVKHVKFLAEHFKLCDQPPACYLDLDRYYLKDIAHFFCAHNGLNKSLFHYFNVMKVLAQSPARDYAVLPYGLFCAPRSGNKMISYGLLFDNLSMDFSIGLPIEKDDRLAWLAQLKEAVTKIHTAGIVHLDLWIGIQHISLDPASIRSSSRVSLVRRETI